MSTKAGVVTAVLMAGCLAGTASAQEPAPAPAPATAPASKPAPQSASPAVDVSKLPLNLDRVQRQLQVAIDREERGSILRYNVNVVAKAPPIVLFTPADNLRYGKTPNSAPTHQDMIDFVTPKEFSSPVMDFNNLIRWIQSRSKSKD